MIGFDEFVKKIYALKVKGEVEVGLLPPNRRTAISTLQIALNRRYTSPHRERQDDSVAFEVRTLQPPETVVRSNPHQRARSAQ